MEYVSNYSGAIQDKEFAAKLKFIAPKEAEEQGRFNKIEGYTLTTTFCSGELQCQPL